MLNLIKTIAFGISPLLGVREIALGIALGLCTFPGHYIGHRLVKRTADALHVLVIEGVMLVGAWFEELLLWLYRWALPSVVVFNVKPWHCYAGIGTSVVNFGT